MPEHQSDIFVIFTVTMDILLEPTSNKLLRDAPTEEVYTAEKLKINRSKDTLISVKDVFIEFGDSYEAPQEESGIGSASESSVKKKGRTVVVTTKDMQKRRNDAEGSETLEQTFNRLQAIVSHLEFMDVEIEQNDLNQKFLTTIAPEWLMYTIVWRHKAKNNSGKGEVNTASIPTASTHVSPASADVAAASISLDTVCAYIASKSNGSQIKYEYINQIDEDDIEEMDIKECRAPRSQDRGRRENYKQGFKIEESAPKALMAIDGVGWDWSYMANEEENHALVADEEASTEFALMAKSSSSSENKVFDNFLCSKSCKKNTDSHNTKITELSEKLSDSKTNLYHYKLGLSQVEARLVEFKTQEIKFCEKIRGIEFNLKNKNIKTERITNELEQTKKEKEVLFPPPAQVYSPPKKDMSWTGLLEFADDTITDYSRPSPSIESNSSDLQNSNSSVSEHEESSKSIMSKPMIKFAKAADRLTDIKTNKVEADRKPSIKYAEILAFYDYHNMIAILEKSKHNVDFHQIVDFVKAFHIRYALTINPTIYVSHIRQFWSTARIETTDEGKKFSLLLMGEGSGTPTEPHHTPSPEAQHSPHYSPSSPSHLHATTETIPTSTPTEIPTLSQGEAFPTISGLEAGHDREIIIKTSALPHDSTPRVTSFDADEGSMQQQPQELTDLCTRLQRQQTKMATKIADQDLEISNLKAMTKILKDKDKGSEELFGDDTPIKGRSLETGEEASVEKITERGSNDTKEMKMVESDMPKKKKLQEQINVQMAREMEDQMARGDQRMDEQITRDVEISRIHAEEELQMLIDELTIGEKIELINELVKNQDHHVKILKYQAQQSKPLSKKQQREFYMSVLKSHSGWKTRHFRGMTLKEIREKFILVWKQIKDCVHMSSTEEGKRMKRKGLRLEQESAKKIKTSEEVSEEDLKEMMRLVPVEERNYWKIIRLGGHTAVYPFFIDMLKHFDREDLNQLWTLVKETLSIRHASSDKEKELWVELKRLFEPNFEEQLWTHTQALMHDPIEWRLYDTCGVYQRSRDFHAS
nr:hypothetical protein [Tanacetum cinerariifolium]